MQKFAKKKPSYRSAWAPRLTKIQFSQHSPRYKTVRQTKQLHTCTESIIFPQKLRGNVQKKHTLALLVFAPASRPFLTAVKHYQPVIASFVVTPFR